MTPAPPNSQLERKVGKGQKRQDGSVVGAGRAPEGTQPPAPHTARSDAERAAPWLPARVLVTLHASSLGRTGPQPASFGEPGPFAAACESVLFSHLPFSSRRKHAP